MLRSWSCRIDGHVINTKGMVGLSLIFSPLLHDDHLTRKAFLILNYHVESVSIVSALSDQTYVLTHESVNFISRFASANIWLLCR